LSLSIENQKTIIEFCYNSIFSKLSQLNDDDDVPTINSISDTLKSIFNDNLTICELISNPSKFKNLIYDSLTSIHIKIQNIINESIDIEVESNQLYYKLSDNAFTILKQRYLLKNSNGIIYETPAGMFDRVSTFVSKIEDNDKRDQIKKSFFNIMCSLDFIPNSPTLMNADTELGQLAACFVIPVEDDLSQIFESIKNAAIVNKTGGGTGFSFSKLRPKNSAVGSTGGVASGPVSFMKVFDAATEQVKQGGRRRGANIGILRIDHPDIEEFITSKSDLNNLNNFNISVAITNDFMKKLKNNEKIELFHSKANQKKLISTKYLFDLICEQAWKTGDPGIIFIDQINEKNPLKKIGLIESTNPCGEQPLLPMEACNLGSINLSNHYDNENHCIDFSKLEKTVKIAVRFLDNVIDVSKYPLKEIEEQVKSNRKIGLGIMGFADLLFKLKLQYDQESSIPSIIMSFIKEKADEESRKLAIEKGEFPNFRLSNYDVPIRNATRTTIAPTGTISIIAGCSSGIEPVFALAFTRTALNNEKLFEINPVLLHELTKLGLNTSDKIQEIIEKGSIQKIEWIPEEIKKIFVCSHDINPESHVNMQSIFQKYTDNAVSKTINLPSSATIDDIKKIYLYAYEKKCKGSLFLEMDVETTKY